MNYKDYSKVMDFNPIVDAYFNRNFGMLGKSEIDLIMFTMFYRAIEDKGDLSELTDSNLAIALGVTKQKVKALRERMDIKYPRLKNNETAKDALWKLMQEIVIDEDDENVSFLVNDTQIRYYIDGFCESSNRIVTYVKGSKVCTLSKDNFKALAFDCMPDDNPKKVKLKQYLEDMEENRGKKFAELIRNQTVWEKIDWEKVFTTGISIASLFV